MLPQNKQTNKQQQHSNRHFLPVVALLLRRMVTIAASDGGMSYSSSIMDLGVGKTRQNYL